MDCRLILLKQQRALLTCPPTSQPQNVMISHSVFSSRGADHCSVAARSSLICSDGYPGYTLSPRLHTSRILQTNVTSNTQRFLEYKKQFYGQASFYCDLTLSHSCELLYTRFINFLDSSNRAWSGKDTCGLVGDLPCDITPIARL